MGRYPGTAMFSGLGQNPATGLSSNTAEQDQQRAEAYITAQETEEIRQREELIARLIEEELLQRQRNIEYLAAWEAIWAMEMEHERQRQIYEEYLAAWEAQYFASQKAEDMARMEAEQRKADALRKEEELNRQMKEETLVFPKKEESANWNASGPEPSFSRRRSWGEWAPVHTPPQNGSSGGMRHTPVPPEVARNRGEWSPLPEPTPWPTHLPEPEPWIRGWSRNSSRPAPAAPPSPPPRVNPQAPIVVHPPPVVHFPPRPDTPPVQPPSAIPGSVVGILGASPIVGGGVSNVNLFSTTNSSLRQSYRGAETITRAGDGESVTVHWWVTTDSRINIRSALGGNVGTTVSNWSTFQNVVNGSFFPMGGNHDVVNSFHVNNRSLVLTSGGTTDGSRNYQDIFSLQNPFDYIMNPINKSTHGLVGFGNGGTFPVTAQNGRTFSVRDVRWGIGGMALNMSDISFNNRTIFNSSWKWRDQMNPYELSRRTAIGYVGGNINSTIYVVAVFSPCEVFDVRAWLRSKGVLNVALNLDGGGSTQARGNGIEVMTSTRAVPTRIVLN